MCCYLHRTSLSFADILPADPKTYDKMRPPRQDGLPTSVYFHVTVMGLLKRFLFILNLVCSFVKINQWANQISINQKGLDSIDENSMTYAADIFFAQTWKDHRLRLPENMTQEYRLIEVDWLKNMWRPDS